MRVVDGITEWLQALGVEHYFGYAGGAVWPLMDALVDHPEMEGIQAKHESHAIHMSDIYFRTHHKLAPVIVTKGPGLLNCVGGVASAMHDMSAVIVIAGSGPTHFLGKGGMQELYYHGFEDAVSVMRPVTKGAWLLGAAGHGDRGAQPGLQACGLRSARAGLHPDPDRRSASGRGGGDRISVAACDHVPVSAGQVEHAADRGAAGAGAAARSARRWRGGVLTGSGRRRADAG